MREASRVIDYRGVRLDLSQPVFSEKVLRAIDRGWYEAEEARAASEMLRDGDTVVEFGGGCGFLACYAARAYTDLTIHSVEANPTLIPVIERHLALNEVYCVTIHNELTSKDDGIAQFFVHEDFWASSSLATPSGAAITVPTASFRRRLSEWEPDVIVMDIEGGEIELFDEQLPSGVRAVIVEVHPDRYGLAGVKRIMDGFSRSGFAYVPKASMRQVLSFEHL